MDGALNPQNTLTGSLSPQNTLTGSLNTVHNLRGELSVPSSVNGVTDYEKLSNKPSIEYVELIGNKTFEELGLESIDNAELMDLLTF